MRKDLDRAHDARDHHDRTGTDELEAHGNQTDTADDELDDDDEDALDADDDDALDDDALDGYKLDGYKLDGGGDRDTYDIRHGARDLRDDEPGHVRDIRGRDRGYRLRFGVGELLRGRRGAARLSQDRLARDAGVTQSLISRVERGMTVPSLDLVERLFAALGLQLRVAVEPLDADLDAELDRLALVPLRRRLTNSELPYLVKCLGDLPYVIEGALAALVQGAPVPVLGADIAVAVRDVDAFDTWLRRRGALRWNERWQEFGYGDTDPRRDGPLRWQVCLGELRARMCRRLPESVEVGIGETVYRVRPLLQLELADPAVAGLVRRYLVRSGAVAGTTTHRAG